MNNPEKKDLFDTVKWSEAIDYLLKVTIENHMEMIKGTDEETMEELDTQLIEGIKGTKPSDIGQVFSLEMFTDIIDDEMYRVMAANYKDYCEWAIRKYKPELLEKIDTLAKLI